MLLSIIGYLAKPESKFVVVPLITIVFGLFLKRTCQNDRFIYSYREYFYWTPNLLSSSLLVVFLDYCNNGHIKQPASYMDNVISAFVLWVITMLLVIWIIRTWGWRKDLYGKITPTILGGILVPNVICIVLLFAVLNIMMS